jgi:hypothetical protein
MQRLTGPGSDFSTVAKADNRPISNQKLRILSNALCLVHKLPIPIPIPIPIPFTGHAKFAAVSISAG